MLGVGVGRLVVRALADGNIDVPLICDPCHLLEQFTDDLMAVGSDPDASPRSHEVGDHLRAHRALP